MPFDWISRYGYVGLFGALMLGIVGLPIPDETILVFCGYLLSKGRMSWYPTIEFAVMGSACGITLSYGIGRIAGYPLVLRYGRFLHIDQNRLDRVHSWFGRTGHWLLTFGYYIAGVRHLTALVAGLSRLEFKIFARYAYLGAVIWVATFLSIGYFLGDHWQQSLDWVRRYTWLAAAIAATVALAVYVVRRRRRLSRTATN